MGNAENILDRLANVHIDVVEMLKGQRAEILEIRQHNDRLVNIQGDVVEMLKGQRQEILEMKRFNQQTRQLWVLIARKMDWLDEDLDIDNL